jgi:hypothetical protein
LNCAKFKIAPGKLAKCKSPGIEQIPAEFFQVVHEALHPEIHTLSDSITNVEEMHPKLQ